MAADRPTLSLVFSLSTVCFQLLLILFQGSHVFTRLKNSSFSMPSSSEQRHAWHTSVQVCGPDERWPQPQLWCFSACTQLPGSWPDLHPPQWEAHNNLKASEAPINKLDAAPGLDWGWQWQHWYLWESWYSRQQAMYLLWLGPHFIIWLTGTKLVLVTSARESCSS